MLLSLLQPLSQTPLAFVDVETTGASALYGHRIIEIGIVRYERGLRVAEYQQLVDPLRPISAGVAALTGISNEMVGGQPTFREVRPAVVELLRDAIVIGHNVRFDLSFLHREFRSAGCDLAETFGPVHVMDTVRIARRRFGRGGNALQSLAMRLGVYPPVAHRALADASTTAGVFEVLMQPIGGWSTCLCDAIASQGGPMGLLPANPSRSLLPLELEEALEQRCDVRMEYVDADGRRTERLIRPLHVRRRGGELVLVAHCHLREAQRTFKLDRIVRLSRPGQPDGLMQEPAAAVVPPPSETAAA